MFKTNLKYITLDEALDFIQENEMKATHYKSLKDYYLGQHPIKGRTLQDPSKPNNKIVSNLPGFAVDIRTGYFSGEPLTIMNDDAAATELLGDILEYNDFQDVNADLDEATSIYGTANLVLWVDEDGEIRMKPLTPLESFVIYDNSLNEEVVGAVMYHKYQEDNQEMIDVMVYNKDFIRHYNGKVSNPTLVGEEPNFFGGVPMVEFVENKFRKGSFEDAISIVDAIEQIMSSSVNEIEYFDNAYMVLKGLNATTQEDVQDMKNNRVLMVDGEGDVSFLTKSINDTYIQNMLDRLTNDFHKLTATPNLTDESFSGNLSGVALQYKMFGLEKQMSKKESKWRKSLQATIELIANLLNMRGADIDYRTYKIVFTRSLPQNVAETVDLVSKLHGMVSSQTLLAQIPFIENPQTELEMLNEEKLANFEQYNFSAIQTTPEEGEVVEEE